MSPAKALIAFAATLALGACQYRGVPSPSLQGRDAEWTALTPHFEHHVTQLPWEVQDPTGEAPGTVVVDTKERYLYLVLPDKRAIRYAVAVGDEAFGWTGTAMIARKAEWPNWTPPPEMVRRWPHVRFTSGGPENPLGARALYLYQGGRDTLYRIHGTNEPDKIGLAVSSGCIRMRNEDVIDLYNRVPVGAKVIVK